MSERHPHARNLTAEPRRAPLRALFALAASLIAGPVLAAPTPTSGTVSPSSITASFTGMPVAYM